MNNTITPREFSRCMSASELWLEYAVSQNEIDYLHAYRYGLRAHYHGERFGSKREGSAFANRDGASKTGLDDGLAGRMCDFDRLLGYAAA